MFLFAHAGHEHMARPDNTYIFGFLAIAVLLISISLLAFWVLRRPKKIKGKISFNYRPFVIGLLGAAIIAIIYFLLDGKNFGILNPQGIIANEQRQLMGHVTLLMLLVVIPVFVMTFFISWKYRESNKKAKYSPEWDNNRMAEAIWWLIPLAIIIAISITIWKSSYALDPYRPLESNKKPVKVQVVALNWKWLFIYPEYDIATVNLLEFPENTPINFEITADAPMNSFWIPQLGGQVYAMAGMTTKLHLQSSKTGDFRGSSANISGEGFSGMKFIARSVDQSDFDSWVVSKQKSSQKLTYDEYQKLALPSKDNPPTSYVTADQNLYSKIIDKYMEPGHQQHMPSTRNEKEEISHH